MDVLSLKGQVDATGDRCSFRRNPFDIPPKVQNNLSLSSAPC